MDYLHYLRSPLQISDSFIESAVRNAPKGYRISTSYPFTPLLIALELASKLGIEKNPYEIEVGDSVMEGFYRDSLVDISNLEKNLLFGVVSTRKEIIICPGEVEIEEQDIGYVKKKLGLQS